MNTITPELIKAAREWDYQAAEGFLDDLPVSFMNVTDAEDEILDRHATEISKSSGVEISLVKEAIVNIALKEDLSRLT